jgi:hypothetical protein
MIRVALAAFKENVYQKTTKNTLAFAKCPTSPLQKYINLGGLPKKMFVHAVLSPPHARKSAIKKSNIFANSKKN